MVLMLLVVGDINDLFFFLSSLVTLVMAWCFRASVGEVGDKNYGNEKTVP